MRILHTADWHIGTKTHGSIDPATGWNTRLIEQQRSLYWLRQQVDSTHPDVLVVSGDIGHRRVLDGTELALIDDFMQEMYRRNIPVVSVQGNHDSEWHWGREPSVKLVMPSCAGSPGTHVVEDINFIMLPYPNRATMAAYEVKPEQFGFFVADFIASNTTPDHPNVVVAHFSLHGAVYAKEQSPLLMGGQDVIVKPSAFSRADLTLLGHLHMEQSFEQRIFYPGSLTTLNFGESKHAAKGVNVYDYDGGTHVVVTRLANPHAPTFLTVKNMDIPEDIMPGTYVRFVLDEHAPDSFRLEAATQAAKDDWFLCGILDRRERVARAKGGKVTEVMTDEQVVREWAKDNDEDADVLLAIMREADEPCD